MSSLSTGALKNVVWDILLYTDKVKEDGARVNRDTFYRDHIKGYNQLKTALADKLEVGVMKTEDFEKVKKGEVATAEECASFKWMPAKDFKKEPGMEAYFQRHLAEPLELTDKMKGALKYYYGEREHLPNMDEATFDLLQEVIS